MKKRKIKIALSREKGSVAITIKNPIELENFFRTISNGETEKSSYWKDANGEGLEFYKITPEYQEKIKSVLENERYFDNFGAGLVDGRSYDLRYNLAILRTANAGVKPITIYSDKFEAISTLELEDYLRRLGAFAKMIWSALINKTRIKSIITFEI